MDRDELTAERIANTASNAAGSLLSIPLVWPRTTTLAVLVALGGAAVIWLGGFSGSGAPPAPNAARLRDMTRAVERADAEVRSRMPASAQPDPELRGVFETMRDQPRKEEPSP